MPDDGTLPDYLLLAVLAAAVPSTAEAYYEPNRKEAAISCAKQSLLSLSATDLKEENPKIEVAETFSLLLARPRREYPIEPPSSLSFVEQEERRRSPVPTLRDDECTMQLPCTEEIFLAGEWQNMLTLDDLLTWNFPAGEGLDQTCLLNLMASVFGRCARYVHERASRSNPSMGPEFWIFSHVLATARVRGPFPNQRSLGR
ncbi:hypothetical protein BDW68DRAFT_173099 [Aspergillus falconensis]